MNAQPPFSPTRDHLEDPYSFYARAREDDPVFFSPELAMWCVSRHEDVSAILGDPVTFSSRDAAAYLEERGPRARAAPGGYRLQRIMLTMDPPGHTALRDLVRQAFSARRVAAMERAIRGIATAMIDEFADDGHADLIGQLAYPLPLTVIFRLLGVPHEDIGMCRQWTGDLRQLRSAGARLPVERQVELAGNLVAYRQYIEDLVAVREGNPGEDLVSYLVQAKDEPGGSRLSLSEVTGIIQGLIIAGHETLANGLGNILYQLLADRSRWEEVRAAPGLIDAAVEEGLRADSPVSGIIRTATRPVTVAGMYLPAGTRLFLLLGSANADERCFPRAGEFRLDRDGQSRHVAFGRGIHYCLGAPLARLEARVALRLLTVRLPGLRLAPGPGPHHVPVPIFRGLARLPVEWDPSPDPG
jgi:cytochrome P450